MCEKSRARATREPRVCREAASSHACALWVTAAHARAGLMYGWSTWIMWAMVVFFNERESMYSRLLHEPCCMLHCADRFSSRLHMIRVLLLRFTTEPFRFM